MKDSRKILELFKKFARNRIDIHGLIVIPVKVEISSKDVNAYVMYFDIKNPNDVPYFT